MRSGMKSSVVLVGAVGLILGGFGIARASGSGNRPGAKNGVAATVPAAPLPTAAFATSPGMAEDSFTPISPCRIVDTRIGEGGRVTATPRVILVDGITNYAVQGGNTSGCGIPADATGISANVVTTNESAAGYLKAYPYGAAVPNASIINFTTVPIANDVSLAVNPGTGGGLDVMTGGAATHVVIDVTGYYQQQIAAYVNADGTVFSHTSRVVSVAHPSAGFYQVTLDTPAENCAAHVDGFHFGMYGDSDTASNNIVDVYTWVLNSTAATVLTDEAFNLTVTC